MLAVTASVFICQPGSGATNDWPAYGHDAAGTRYSPLAQIDCKNVSRLKVAWIFHTGDISAGSPHQRRSGFESTPLFVDGTLFVTTGFSRVIALDPATGVQRWAFDPKMDLTLPYGDGLINRGVATWLDSQRASDRPCYRRIFEATDDARLVALDAATGRPCEDFGKAGIVILRNVERYAPGVYHMTSPPAVIDDLVVVGSAINDNDSVDMPSGVVRAYDARTGALRWSWNPLPPNGSRPRWRTGAANAWPPMAVDAQRHLVFVSTGSASPDYYGGLRPGDDKWADSIVALHSQTGKLAWGFQLVHHDLWDYDTAAPPLLATIHRNGQAIPVVIAGNKTGFVYVLNRDTGAPIFPVNEGAVPKSDVPGEVTSPTQPFPSAPPALLPHVAPNEPWGITSADRETCRQWIGRLQYKGIFTPPSLQGSLVAPGNLGGLNWSGYALDPQQGLLIANTNNLPAEVKLIPRAPRDLFEEARRNGPRGDYAGQTGAPYGMFRRFLLSSSHLPCNAPPWGVLSAVDLNRGTIRWQIPLGSMAGFGGGPAQAVPQGMPSLGGPIVTAGGLVFVAGTFDDSFRAFDIQTGKQVWSVELPASGNAVPMTYKVNGKQYVVIAAGGHAQVTETKQSDALVAFALP
jgi:quinoprotein glucose dehydrogenase